MDNLESKALTLFGERVRELRKHKNWTQEELAFRTNLHRTYIGAVERGEQNISLKNIVKIAAALDVDIAVMFTDWDS